MFLKFGGIELIRLEPVTPENWRLDLSVKEDQRRFVSDRIGILARAYAYRDCRSQAFVIYQEDLPVGMAMYYDCPEESEYVFSQFFIDWRYQGNGFGYEAAKLVLQNMKCDGQYDKVCLCYIDGDHAARRLYERLGFHHTGEVYDGEIIMEQTLRQVPAN